MQEYFDKSYADLGLEYIDLYLMHTPFAFEHVPGDLHPKNPDGTMRVDLTTDLIAVWKVSTVEIMLFKKVEDLYF